MIDVAVNLDYDVKAAFEAIEHELMMSMIRNMRRHRVEEITEGKQWAMWQAMQIRSLEKYRRQNARIFGKRFGVINRKLDALIRVANDQGMMEQETAILKAIKKGYFSPRRVKGGSAEFFKLNDRKINALIKATTDDMQRAEVAVLRMANDRYRQVIFNAQMYANTGAATYEKAVDMATRDFASAGMNCVEYSNGARHTVADYADMAIRTAAKRAYLQGEGTKRQEWGIHTVIMNKRTAGGLKGACPKCLPFAGKVLIDDVWSGGSAADGPYPLMSEAIEAGLYHPRCKDAHTTYFPGVSTPPDDTFTWEEVQEVTEAAREEARAQYAQREAERHQRIAETRLDPENREIEEARAREAARVAEERQRALEAEEHRRKIEGAFEHYVSGEGTYVNNYLAGRYEELGATWTEADQKYLDLLDEGTKGIVKQDKLWRSVDASSIFGEMSSAEYEDLCDYLAYGESAVPKKKAEEFRKKLEEATGKTITEPRFMSTTADKEVAMGWGDFSGSRKPIVLELDVPEGIHGADLKHLDLEDDPQSEVLLARGQKYKVKSIGVEDGQIVVKAELIPPDEAAEDIIAGLPDQAKEIVKSLRDDYGPWVGSLSEKEKEAIIKYTNLEEPFYSRLNAMLRGDIPEDPELREYAEVISGALKRQPLKRETICYRNLDVNPFEGLVEGDVAEGKQFYSTAVDPSGTLPGKYHLTIIAPKGTPGAYIETISIIRGQLEFLIDKSCKYRILSIEGYDIFVEVVV